MNPQNSEQTTSGSTSEDVSEPDSRKESLLSDWKARQTERAKVDLYYGSYSNIQIHQEMLEDKARTEAYRRAILNSSALFKDKVVMDLGAGTLILSLFAIEAGAKRVYAVEKATITRYWDSIIKENGMEGRIIGVRGSLEEVELPEKVDIIVCQWMGYWLLFEMMINSLIVARDRWLKPNGLMFPDRATMFVGLGSCSGFYQNKVGFWKNVYGYKMPSLARQYSNEVFIELLPADQLVHEPVQLAVFDLRQMEEMRMNTYANCRLAIRFDQPTTLYELVGWFSVSFPDGTKLDTGPRDPPTHWKQSIMLLPTPIAIERGTLLTGELEVTPNRHQPRKLLVECLLKVDGTTHHQKYCFA